MVASTPADSGGAWAPNALEKKTYAGRRILSLPQLEGLSNEERAHLERVVAVLPFKANGYVVENLIDWSDFRNDPIFHLTFPQLGMVPEVESVAPLAELDHDDIIASRSALNPDPAGQAAHNVPTVDGVRLTGLQHKYPQTLLVFPRNAQTCHTYCGYCFRWPQFVESDVDRHTAPSPELATSYLRQHPEVTDVLFTGNDPMIMSTANLEKWVEPILSVDSVHNIRIGTKSLSYWPYRFTHGEDADALLALLGGIADSGRTVHLMAHLSHPREMSTGVFREAVRRLRDVGVLVRSQAPLVAHVNDDATTWAQLWAEQVRLGIHPYYMFVDRPTGAHAHYEVPLAKALDIYTDAIAQVSGLARTARGPVMSTDAGKVHIAGTVEVAGQRQFVMKFLQARDPERVGETVLLPWDADRLWWDPR